MNKFHRTNIRGGFTLIEILVVVVIIGILAAVIVPRIMSRPDEARVTMAKTGLKSVEGALAMYKLDNGTYPSTEQGLRALVEKPSSGNVPKSWNPDGYLKKIPKDPWGNDFIYLSPGLHGDFDLVCMGADGDMGGEGFNADINGWELE